MQKNPLNGACLGRQLDGLSNVPREISYAAENASGTQTSSARCFSLADNISPQKWFSGLRLFGMHTAQRSSECPSSLRRRD